MSSHLLNDIELIALNTTGHHEGEAEELQSIQRAAAKEDTAGDLLRFYCEVVGLQEDKEE